VSVVKAIITASSSQTPSIVGPKGRVRVLALGEFGLSGDKVYEQIMKTNKNQHTSKN
jgi:hypothetical protein